MAAGRSLGDNVHHTQQWIPEPDAQGHTPYTWFAFLSFCMCVQVCVHVCAHWCAYVCAHVYALTRGVSSVLHCLVF